MYVIVGLGEEFSKYVSLRLYTWRSREFNCLYDGMVYAAAVAAGFALQGMMFDIAGNP